MSLNLKFLKTNSCKSCQYRLHKQQPVNNFPLYHHKVAQRNNPVTRQTSITTEENYTVNTDFQKHLLEDEDVQQLIKDYNFPIPSDALIEKAKKFVMSQVGSDKFGLDRDLLSDDFEFTGQVLGPLDKEGFLNVLESFDVMEIMPDLTQNFHNFTIDPFQPNRVWMFNASRGTNTGPFPGGRPPTGKRYIGAPEMQSVTFNEQGLVCKYTIGYVLDRTVGNTGGVGAVFGIFQALGIPIPMPEAQPYKKSWQRRVFDLLQLFVFWMKRKE